MKTILAVAIAALAAVAVCYSSPATAQTPSCGGGCGWGGCGMNYPYGLYGSRIEEVPYYSLFPPVYYSLPVPRSYGWSPFAYPPGTMTPEVTADEPQEINNPYVPQNNKDSTPAKPSSARTASYHPKVPQVLVNPFVKSEAIAVTASTNIASK